MSYVSVVMFNVINNRCGFKSIYYIYISKSCSYLELIDVIYFSVPIHKDSCL